MPDVNDIKAGRYELLDLQWDEPTSKPGDPVFTFTRHYKGEVLDLDEANARRMVLAGSVAQEGELERQALAAARAQYLAALAALPDDVRATEGVRNLSVEDVQTAVEDLPDEERTVATSRGGFTPPGAPRYGDAAHGEGDGGPVPGEEGGENQDPAHIVDADGRVVEGETQALQDDGTGDVHVAKKAVRETEPPKKK